MTDMDDPSEPTDPIDAQFEPAPPSADHVVPPEKPRKTPGWMALIATGVLATILGAGLGAGISGHSNSASGSSSDTSADTSQYQSQIAALEADQQKLGSRLAALSADLEQAETRLAEEIASAANAPDTDQDETLSETLATLSARVDLLSALPEGEGEDTGALSARLLAFEQSLANLQTGQGTRAEALAALTTRLTALEASASEEGGVDQSELVSLYEDISNLKSQLTNLTEDTANHTDLAARLDQIETRDTAALSALSEGQSSGQAALALIAFQSASDRGVPFPELIPALETAGADAGLLVDLRTIAPTGAPNMTKLQNMLYGGLLAARAQTGAEQGADDTGRDDGWGWVRRTFGDSVKITPPENSNTADANTNQTLEDIANDAGSLLSLGNITAAMAELDKLEGAEYAAFSDWREAAARRLKLDAALISLSASLLEQER